MSARDSANLVDILEAGRKVRKFMSGRDRAAFEADELLQAAVMRELEIMGEATKRLSSEFRNKSCESALSSARMFSRRRGAPTDVTDESLDFIIS